MLLDILLLPKELYKRISAKRITLFMGIFFVGVLDIAIPRAWEDFPKIFLEKPWEDWIGKLGLILLFSALIGALDVIVFSVPLFDLFKRFKKQGNYYAQGNDQCIRLMKVYIITHIVLLPATLAYYFLTKNLTENSSAQLLSLAAYGLMLVIIWFNAVITRGANAIYDFDPPFRKLVFPAVFIWGFLSGMALEYIIDGWIIPLIT